MNDLSAGLPWIACFLALLAFQARHARVPLTLLATSVVARSAVASPLRSLHRDHVRQLAERIEAQAWAGALEGDEDLAAQYATWEAEVRAAGPGGRHDSWARFYFDRSLNARARQALLLMYAKLLAEGIWEHVEAIGWVERAGRSMTVGIYPKGGSTALWRSLTSRRIQIDGRSVPAYGDWYQASRGDRWGLRSAKVGAELHLVGPVGSIHAIDASGDFGFPFGQDQVKVHIDLNNPGEFPEAAHYFERLRRLDEYLDRGGRHVLEDDLRRDETHTPETIQAALEAQGIAIPRVQERVPMDALQAAQGMLPVLEDLRAAGALPPSGPFGIPAAARAPASEPTSVPSPPAVLIAPASSPFDGPASAEGQPVQGHLRAAPLLAEAVGRLRVRVYLPREVAIPAADLAAITEGRELLALLAARGGWLDMGINRVEAGEDPSRPIRAIDGGWLGAWDAASLEVPGFVPDSSPPTTVLARPRITAVVWTQVYVPAHEPLAVRAVDLIAEHPGLPWNRDVARELLAWAAGPQS
jgi:hypothetical protein